MIQQPQSNRAFYKNLISKLKIASEIELCYPTIVPLADCCWELCSFEYIRGQLSLSAAAGDIKSLSPQLFVMTSQK